ncbi:hypothetical protein [Alloactinosynnema sp. L-07]|nr:hypothetical protein [Alloactinosynnema sp. L-07]
MKALAGLVLAAGWVVLGRSIFFGTYDVGAIDDLEAGGRFAANFAVFWPFMLGTVIVGGVVVAALFPRPATAVPVLVTAVMCTLFAIWVRIQDFMFTAFPSVPLGASLLVIFGTAAAALAAVAVLAGVLGRRDASARVDAGHPGGRSDSYGPE